jgi:hypothetical protein
MNKQNELAVVTHEAGAVMRPAPTPEDMMQAMIDKGVTAENVAAFKELVVLSEHMEDRNAIRQFNAAFAKLQTELPTITAKSVIPNRGKYEKFEDIMAVIKKPLSENGFSISFSQDFKEGRILEICTLRHDGGHVQTNSFAVRSGKADSDTQADCKASTTAKRNALCNALNIVIRQDCLNNEDDAGIEGDPNAKVTAAQAEELERRVNETNSNRAAFLQFAKAAKFSEILANKYEMLDETLSRKERQGR